MSRNTIIIEQLPPNSVVIETTSNLVSSHSNLSGLTADDHLQYVHVSNDRTITANHNLINGIDFSGIHQSVAYVPSNVDISGGNINGTAIGAINPAQGFFTTLNINGNQTQPYDPNNINITGGNINGTTIGQTYPASGNFSSITINGSPLVNPMPSIAANSITYDKLSNSGTASLNAQKRMAKAWVNFNGSGVISIRDSFNVSSITDNGVGNYTINFATPFANTNYCVTIFARDIDNDSYVANLAAVTLASVKTVNSFMVYSANIRNGILYDSSEYNVIVMAG